MRSHIVVALALAFPVAAFASPTDTAIVAAMKIPDAPNYAWHTDVVDDARTYEISGKTDRATDLSTVNMPLVSSIRRRTSPSRGASSVENVATAIFKGDEKFVLETESGWQSPDDISANDRGGDWRGRGGPGGYGGRMSRSSRTGGGGRYPSGDSGGRGPTPPYSNLQKTLSRPHEEIAIIVAGFTDLKIDGDVVSGTLSETAAKLLLVHAGQKEITPKSASGTFRLWIQNGVLTKYETKLEGALSVETNSGKREIAVHQTATTTITDIGTTTFDVPAAAKKKLGVAVATPAQATT